MHGADGINGKITGASLPNVVKRLVHPGEQQNRKVERLGRMKMKAVMGGMFLLLCMVLSCTPVSALERFDIVTTEELHELMEKREAGKVDFLLVNTLDTLVANHHSIPGSVNLPWSTVKESNSVLGEDTDKLIITYCMGYR